MWSRRAVLILGGSVLQTHAQNRSMFADAEAYERFMGRWSRLIAPRLIDFAGVADQGSILDVGCGTGSLALAIAERKPQTRVTGVDLSKEYVGYANGQRGEQRVHFEVGDAQHLSFPDEAFDASLSLLVLNFIPQPRQALAEMRRVTRPRGRIAAAVWDYGGGMRMLRVFWDAAVALNRAAERLDEKHMPLCRAGELRQLWTQGGLKQVDERRLEVDMSFQSFGEYWEPFLLGQGPAGAYVKSLRPEDAAELRDEVRRRLGLGRPDAPFRLMARAWAVRGDAPE